MRKKITLALLSLLLVPLGMMAQSSSVTISPATGSMLAGVASGYSEQGVRRGWSSMWQHDQLPLTLVVSDETTLTSTNGGQLKNAAGNINQDGDDIVIMGGKSRDCYMTIALPKGFRITGYEMTILNNRVGEVFEGMEMGSSSTKVFYETGSDFTYTRPKATATESDETQVMPASTTDTREYVISRESTGTSEETEDMGNILYFRIVRSEDEFYALTFKDIIIYYTAEANFTQTVAPSASDQNGVSYKNISFETQKVDIGPLATQRFSDTGNTYLVYQSSKVTDLKANIVLFEDDAVGEDGVVGSATGNKGITAEYVNAEKKNYYGLKANTYYVESPVNAKTQNGKNVNLGYRIVNARLNYAAAQVPTEKFNISQGDYYMNTNGERGNYNSRAIWTIDNDGYVVNQNGQYLTYVQKSSFFGDYYATSVSNTKSTKWTKNADGKLYTRIGNSRNYYIQHSDWNGFQLTSSSSNGLAVTYETKSANYTLRVYNETGKRYRDVSVS